jgi:hypothetical protein
MQQTADWLEKLGMSEYARRFAENGINFQALRYLTDQDLKDIGVLLGHRRIMLAAIAELAGPAVTTPHRAPRPGSCSQRQGSGGGSRYLRGHKRITVNWRGIPATAVPVRFGLGPRGAWSIR